MTFAGLARSGPKIDPETDSVINIESWMMLKFLIGCVDVCPVLT